MCFWLGGAYSAFGYTAASLPPSPLLRWDGLLVDGRVWGATDYIMSVYGAYKERSLLTENLN